MKNKTKNQTLNSIIISLALLFSIVACSEKEETKLTELISLGINAIEEAYTSGTAVTGATEGAVDIVKVSSSQTIAAADLLNVDGFDLSASSAAVTLTVNANAVEGLTHTTPALLTSVHKNIATTGKVLIILRSKANQVVTVSGLVDTTVRISIVIGETARTFNIYAKSATISDAGNTAFVFVEYIASTTPPTPTTPEPTPTALQEITISTLSGTAYESGTDVSGGTEDGIELVKVATNQTVQADNLGDIDGVDLRQTDATPVALTLNTAVVEGIEHDTPTGLTDLHTAFEGNKVLLVLRNSPNQVLVSDMEDTTVNISARVSEDEGETYAIRTFRVYAQKAAIANEANAGFVLLEYIAPSDRASLEITTVETAYMVSTAVSSGAVNAERVDLVKIAANQTVTAANATSDLTNVDGFDLSTVDVGTSVRLVMNAAAVAGLSHSAPEALRDLHPSIEASDKVIIILRDEVTQTWVTTTDDDTDPDLVDTGVNVSIQIETNTRPFSIYSQNADITHAGMEDDTPPRGNSVFVFYEDVSSLFINTVETAYAVGTAVTAGDVNADRIDIVKSSVTQEITAAVAGGDSAQLTNVDGFDLSDASGTVALTLNAAAIRALTHSAPAALRALHSSIGNEDKVVLVLRDEATQTLMTDLLDTGVKVSVKIGDDTRDFDVYSVSADITSDDNNVFVLLEYVMPPAEPVTPPTPPTTTSAFTITRVLDGPYAAAAADTLDDDATDTEIDLIKVTASPTTVTASHLENVDGFDLRDAPDGGLALDLTVTELEATDWPTAHDSLVGLHAAFTTNKKIVVVLRDNANQILRGGSGKPVDTGVNLSVMLTIGDADASSVTFSVYAENDTITHDDNGGFLLLQDVSPTALTATQLTGDYDPAAAARTDGTEDALEIVNTSATASDVTVNVTHLANIDGINLREARSAIALNLPASTATGVDMGHEAPSLLTNLHPDIGADDHVLFVLRDDDNQTLATGTGFVDTGVDISVRLTIGSGDAAPVTFDVYSKNADITHNDNDAFLLWGHLPPAPVLEFSNIDSPPAYDASGAIMGGVEGTLELVSVTSDTTIDTAQIVNFDGANLKSATEAVVLTLSATELNDLGHTVGSIRTKLTDLFASIPLNIDTTPAVAAAKAFIILRDETNQTVSLTGTFTEVTGTTLRAQIQGTDVEFTIFSAAAIGDGETNYVIVQNVDGAHGVTVTP